MKAIRRVTVGIKARLDEVLSHVENHEALAESALAELRQSLGRARGQLGRVRRDGARLADDQKQAEREAELWRDRARRTDPGQQEQALECLRRSKVARVRAEGLGERLREHEAVERKLGREIAMLEERFRELETRRRILSTREARARAVEIASQETLPRSGSVDDVFERWEVQLCEREYPLLSVDDEVDELSDRLSSEEERQELLGELEALRGDK